MGGVFFRKWEDLLRKGGRAIERQTWTRHRRAWKGSADALEQEGSRCAPPAPSMSLPSFSCSFSSSVSFSSSYSSSSASSSASSSLLASFSCSSSCFLVVALILLLSLQWKALRCPPPALYCFYTSAMFVRNYFQKNCRWVLSSTFVTLFVIVRQKKQF